NNSIWMSDLTIKPDNKIFLTTTYNGVYRSTNLGLSWEPTNSNLPSTEFYGMYYTNIGLLYLLSTIGIYISDDDGDSWTKSSFPDLITLSFCKTSSGRLLAGAIDPNVWTKWGGVLYKSDNDGIS